jgi:hypothetical protein
LAWADRCPGCTPEISLMASTISSASELMPAP